MPNGDRYNTIKTVAYSQQDSGRVCVSVCCVSVCENEYSSVQQCDSLVSFIDKQELRVWLRQVFWFFFFMGFDSIRGKRKIFRSIASLKKKKKKVVKSSPIGWSLVIIQIAHLTNTCTNGHFSTRSWQGAVVHRLSALWIINSHLLPLSVWPSWMFLDVL